MAKDARGMKLGFVVPKFRIPKSRFFGQCHPGGCNLVPESVPLFSLGPLRRQCKIMARVLVGPRFGISTLYILYFNLFDAIRQFASGGLMVLRMTSDSEVQTLVRQTAHYIARANSIPTPNKLLFALCRRRAAFSQVLSRNG
jgi:hypothetical protein